VTPERVLSEYNEDLIIVLLLLFFFFFLLIPYEIRQDGNHLLFNESLVTYTATNIFFENLSMGTLKYHMTFFEQF